MGQLFFFALLLQPLSFHLGLSFPSFSFFIVHLSFVLFLFALSGNLEFFILSLPLQLDLRFFLLPLPGLGFFHFVQLVVFPLLSYQGGVHMVQSFIHLLLFFDLLLDFLDVVGQALSLELHSSEFFAFPALQFFAPSGVGLVELSHELALGFSEVLLCLG